MSRTIAKKLILMPTIEELWQALRRSSVSAIQQRVDAQHPLDLYVDFEPPNRPGLVAICPSKGPTIRPLRAVAVDQGQRADGRWFIRLSLDEPHLLPVFAALCRDIIEFARKDIDAGQLASVVLSRLDHWRKLLEQDRTSLGELRLRGLIGELLVFETLIATSSPAAAASSWTGPLGTPQDFTLSDGRRIEVKAAKSGAQTVHISGLKQLDTGADPLELRVVRLEDTGTAAPGAVTAPLLIKRIAEQLSSDSRASETFAGSLALLGWSEHASHDDFAVRPVGIDSFVVEPGFPRLTPATVPVGVEEANYVIRLPMLPDLHHE
jgi:hypothetical protein